MKLFYRIRKFVLDFYFYFKREKWLETWNSLQPVCQVYLNEFT